MRLLRPLLLAVAVLVAYSAPYEDLRLKTK